MHLKTYTHNAFSDLQGLKLHGVEEEEDNTAMLLLGFRMWGKSDAELRLGGLHEDVRCVKGSAGCKLSHIKSLWCLRWQGGRAAEQMSRYFPSKGSCRLEDADRKHGQKTDKMRINLHP